MEQSYMRVECLPTYDHHKLTKLLLRELLLPKLLLIELLLQNTNTRTTTAKPELQLRHSQVPRHQLRLAATPC
jgi:hypothetical protein